MWILQVAYVPQTAFIFGASVKDNILFGLPYDAERYQRAIKASALGPDLDNFPGKFFLFQTSLLGTNLPATVMLTSSELE